MKTWRVCKSMKPMVDEQKAYCGQSFHGLLEKLWQLSITLTKLAGECGP